jgi:hypothetical protein
LWHRLLSVLPRTSSHTSKLFAQFYSTVKGADSGRKIDAAARKGVVWPVNAAFQGSNAIEAVVVKTNRSFYDQFVVSLPWYEPIYW